MTKQEWLNYVITHKDKLKEFIRAFHPVNLRPHAATDVMNSNITAPQAERACEIVRGIIRNESLDYPDIQFDIAIQKEDCNTISSLLSSAWFGVPESTSCWYITGFKEAVDLLDDPIEEDYDFVIDN